MQGDVHGVDGVVRVTLGIVGNIGEAVPGVTRGGKELAIHSQFENKQN